MYFINTSLDYVLEANRDNFLKMFIFTLFIAVIF